MSRQYKKDDSKRKGSRKGKFVKKDRTNTAELNANGRNNDPNWYFTDAGLADQASQLSFQSVLGTGTIYGMEVPSIMRIGVGMGPGVTYRRYASNQSLPDVNYHISAVHQPNLEPGKAGVNLMAAKLYTTLSSFTGRTASYAPQDVAMMILAISSIAEFSEHLRRAFGLALTYNNRNRTLPLGLIASMGIDPNDLAANLSVYRMRFNVALARINQVPLLENIAFIKKSRDIYQNIYMDDATNMSQIFYYAPDYAYTLNETGDTDGSILQATVIWKGSSSGIQLVMPMIRYLEILEQMITAVLESSTLNFIYADLLNMANKLSVQTWKFDYLAENYVVMPQVNANASLQLHNLTAVGRPGLSRNSATGTDDDNWNAAKHQVTFTDAAGATHKYYLTGGAHIFCDANSNDIVFNPVFMQRGYNTKMAVVDMFTDNPSVEDRIEALRYTATGSGTFIDMSDASYGQPTHTWSYTYDKYFETCMNLPDHYVTVINVFSNVESSTTGVVIRRGTYDVDSSYVDTENITHRNMSQWNHNPIIYVCNNNKITSCVGDLEYYTIINSEYIQRLLDIISVGLFDFRV